jgi:hypothetical protein
MFLGGVWGEAYMAPNHINFFNLKSIRMLFVRYGFEIKDYQIIDEFLHIGLIKNRLKNKRDWATSDPPIMVEHNIIIPNTAFNHRDYVRYIDLVPPVDKFHNINDKKTVGNFYSLSRGIYHGFSNLIHLKFKIHIILTAKKMN